MGCEYCTPRIDPDTGESVEVCKGFHHFGRVGKDEQMTRIHLVEDKDDGEWSWVILLHSEWLSDHIHSLGEKASHAGMIATTIPAPPYCPWCGRKLYA